MARSVALLPGWSLVIFGCTSPEELRQRDEAACTSYGFQPGTPELSACLQREAAARRCERGPTLSLHVKPRPAPPPWCHDPL